MKVSGVISQDEKLLRKICSEEINQKDEKWSSPYFL
jgi:hypothetical protein